jgi:hypothetical protein
MSAQFLKQDGAEHDVAVLATLAALNVRDHASAIDVADLQARELGAAHAGAPGRNPPNWPSGHYLSWPVVERPFSRFHRAHRCQPIDCRRKGTACSVVLYGLGGSSMENL